MNKAPSALKKWVVFRLSSLGDVTLLSGVLDYWQREHGWRFVIITREAFAPALYGHPAIEEIISLKPEDLKFTSTLVLFHKFSVRYKEYGLLDLHVNLRSRLLSMFWKGPVLRYPKLRAERKHFLKTHDAQSASLLKSLNVTQRYALAAEATAPERKLLVPRIYLSRQEKETAWKQLSDILPEFAGSNMLSAPVALHPFATHYRKAWPREHWIELVENLEARKVPWIVVGQGEPLFPDDLRDLCNHTSLRELCALLACCRVLVTGDSGPMHLAAGSGIPVLALFGPTVEEWGFFPTGDKHHILQQDLECRPCSLHGSDHCDRNGLCMKKISPDTVLEALGKFIN